MNNTLEFITYNSDETQAFGTRLGARLKKGDLLLLCGELGSGKTTLAQGIAWGLGVRGYAHSPTFILINEYHGRIPLYHLDLYRLDSLDEVLELGIEEMLTRGACVVEWAQKAMSVWPKDYLSIELSQMRPEERLLRLTPLGDQHTHLASKFRSRFSVH